MAIGRDDALPLSQRAALVGAGTYVVSPIGLVPGFIPLVGQLDDLYVLLRAIRYALDGLAPVTRSAYLDAAEITEQDIEADFESVSEMVGWTARRGRNTAVRAAAGGLRAGRRLAGGAGRLRNELLRRLAERRNDPDGFVG